MVENVDLWLWALDVDTARQEALALHLSDAERRRAERFVRPQDRVHFIVARGRMREILSERCAIAPACIEILEGTHGKPYLALGPEFNLSHAAGWAALAVADTMPVGVDIEQFRTVEPEVAERFFSPAENADLHGLHGADWARGFFRCWTRKEAVIKAHGGGLSLALDGFDVTLRPDAPVQVHGMRLPCETGADWQLHHLDLAPDFVGAVAARGPVRLRLREGSLPLS